MSERETEMGKGNSNKGNKEARKPKKSKEKLLATSNSNTVSKELSMGKKKGK